jgi:hypothetical protein
MTSPREQYGVTVHLFIGTGRILGKIKFMSLTFTIIQKVSYRGLSSLFPFRSVSFSITVLVLSRSFSITASELVHPSSSSRLSYHVHLHFKAEASCESILYWKTC